MNIVFAYCCQMPKNKTYGFVESNNNKIINYKTMKLANDNNLKRIIILLYHYNNGEHLNGV